MASKAEWSKKKPAPKPKTRVQPKLARPLDASLAKGLATTGDLRAMTDSQATLRTCCICGSIFKNGGYAWRCERAHASQKGN